MSVIIPGAAGGGAGAEGNKSVMFSDGIRPGGDLTELDGRPEGHRWEQTSGGKYIFVSMMMILFQNFGPKTGRKKQKAGSTRTVRR